MGMCCNPYILVGRPAGCACRGVRRFCGRLQVSRFLGSLVAVGRVGLVVLLAAGVFAPGGGGCGGGADGGYAEFGGFFG